MSRIFIAACTNIGKERESEKVDQNKQAMQIILLRDRIVSELRSRGYQILSVPDDYTSQASIQWINDHSHPEDIALELNSHLRETSIFYIANNTNRQKQAELLLLLLSRRVPQMVSEGFFPDTATPYGKLDFCRQLIIPSLVMKIGFLNLPDEQEIIRNMALGIADGLLAWSQEVVSAHPPDFLNAKTYQTIKIKINQRDYDEQGLLINGNAYITIDLADRLGIDLTKSPSIRPVEYQGIVYVKAIDLREHNISVKWDERTFTVFFRSIFPICQRDFGWIMGHGNTSITQLTMFLKHHNEKAFANFPDLPELYQKEAAIEGVNHDIAFCQMCLETDFLHFEQEIKPSQNNFAGLGTIGGGATFATFTSRTIGVRAHIQHLKAYASREPLIQEVIDPRFDFVTRGVAPHISQLSGRWSANLTYGDKIMAMLRRLYELANLL
ncbi:MAG: glucosaminidase domain-containing protein [Gomphosphaeria aponina SAG 52.96 = DSM 107014]|uniref:Glucosaminidase domain-containing protein n=1 Tax=Gomphosphaeria aponina SAG 52.96 = DSM 107014 TaxID=1521640 RepID=A0A941GP85_9CHRO|nr:glucosaminidase domain-containing protein [Gomphosphaeria aponina SAG 52.96 = DSM 107014]